MDAGLIVAIVALLLGAGSLLVAAYSLYQSMVGKRTDIQIQAEQRKQEALGILRQAQLSLELTAGTFKAIYQSASSERDLVNESYKETIRQFGEKIKVIEEMKPPQGKVNTSYLVLLETNIGYAEGVRSLAEHSRALLSESLKTRS